MQDVEFQLGSRTGLAKLERVEAVTSDFTQKPEMSAIEQQLGAAAWSEPRRRDGAGLGLTITKGIIDAHGGRLWVDSKEGVGTMFSTWLPVAISDASTIVRRRSGLFKTPVPKPVPPKEGNS